MKTVRPSLTKCRVAAKTVEEEELFIEHISPILPEVNFLSAQTNMECAVKDADILVTATSAQAPLLKAAWMKPGSFYSHIGGWKDEYAVAQQCDKIVCDHWETIKHRTQTLSRMYKDGVLHDSDIHANLDELVTGEKHGRDNDNERIYFNAVGLSYVDIAITLSMYRRAIEHGFGQKLAMQETTIFEHSQISKWFRR